MSSDGQYQIAFRFIMVSIALTIRFHAISKRIQWYIVPKPIAGVHATP